MAGLVQAFAARVGWTIRPCNVIVEGTSDVTLLRKAAQLYLGTHNTPLLGSELGILYAGKGDDGGVDGVNRRLTALRQMADVDRAPDGGLRYRFIALYDNDTAGRLAVENACNVDPRLRRYRDLFLLHPIMPAASTSNFTTMEQHFVRENTAFKGLDWEIEDYISEKFLALFEKLDSSAVVGSQETGGKKHRDYTKSGKYQLHQFVLRRAALPDLNGVIRLLRSLRCYHRLPFDHIIC